MQGDEQKGDKIYYKDLAETLKRIAREKRDGFYSGLTAQLIVEEMERGKGWISLEDLANYKAIWRDPVKTKYKQYHITSMGPPSSGGMSLIQLLEMVEDFPVADYGWNSDKYVHLVSEAEKRVYADRGSVYGRFGFLSGPGFHFDRNGIQ